MASIDENDNTIPILPADVPVPEPELPDTLVVNTLEQFHALSDSTRYSIIGLLNQKPQTAKQIATAIHISTGSAGHHLQVLETAGYIKVIAKRQVKGIIAKYYSRTAKTFVFEFPNSPEISASFAADILAQAKRELTRMKNAAPAIQKLNSISSGFPHSRISPERAQYYVKKINELLDEFTHEPSDENGELFGFLYIFFPAGYQESMKKETGELNDNK